MNYPAPDENSPFLTPLHQAPVLLSAAPEQHETEAQFRELMTHLQQVFWMKNAADTAVLYVSPAYEKIWGRTCSSLYDNSHTFLDAIHPDDRDRVAEAMARKQETEGYAEEYRLLRPDGTTRWIFARSYPVRDERGEIIRYAGIAEDISERKRLEKEQARLAAIIETAEDAVVSLNLDGFIIAWNRGAERKYGYTAEEIVGHSITLLIPPEHRQEYSEMMKRVRKGEPVASYDTVRRRKDGTLINFAVGISPIEALDGEIIGVSKISHDISRVRKLEAQLIEAQKMEVIGQLTSGVAHDFNNILSVIFGYAEFMVEDLGPDHPLCESVAQIRLAAERGAGLAQQLLVFGRKETVQPVILDLNELLVNSEAILRQLIDEGTELSVICGTPVGRIKANPGYVGQVLMNLVVNARDAMPGGGKISIATSEVTLDENYVASHPSAACGAYVLLSVSDTGTGMSKEIQAHLFEPFFTTKPRGIGTGLGLTTCQTIVKQSGGHIGLYSEEGKGTTFKIYFPRVVEPIDSVLRPPQLGPLPRGTEAILVVEDDPNVRHLVCKVLQTQGYEVLAATNGENGLKTFFNHQGSSIRLVICDVIMPHMGGKVMAERLKAKSPDLKILFSSGYTDDAIARHGVLDPGTAFLSKPYSSGTLARKVRELLDASL